jgi:hypothetical protein
VIFVWVHPGGMVSGEGAHVAPEDFVGAFRAAGAAIDAVGPDFGASWGGERVATTLRPLWHVCGIICHR